MSRDSIALVAIGLAAALAGCDGRPADAGLVSPRAVHWEGAQLIVEGQGFPAGAQGELCLDGRWHAAETGAGSNISRCVDAWAQADTQIVSAWRAPGVFVGSLSLRFKGVVADIHGRLEDTSFAAGTGANVSPVKEGTRAWLGTPRDVAPWASLLLLIFALTRTRVGAGLFVAGQVLGHKRQTNTRALLIATIVCVCLSFVPLPVRDSTPWFVLASALLHPNLMSWLRALPCSKRMLGALLLWFSFSIAVLGVATLLQSGTIATRLVLISLGIYALATGHAWLDRRRITDEIGLGLSAWLIADVAAIAPQAALALAVCVIWVSIRSAGLLHWSSPSFTPLALGLLCITGIEVLAWLEPSSGEWTAIMGAVVAGCCALRVFIDTHGAVRQLSPIGAPDQTLPDLTLA